MKYLITCIVLIGSTTFLSAQIDCKPYVPATVGTSWELTSYNDKGKLTGRIEYELVDKVVNGNDITFSVKTTTYDKKDKPIFSSSFDAKCSEGRFAFDMAFMMDGSSMQAYQDMDVSIDASDYEIPSMDAAAGTTLPDGTLTIKIAGPIAMNMTVFVTDRKIEKKESVTTPAGTFKCLVSSQNVSTKMVVNVNSATKEWYAEGIGLVKSESYSQKGKLQGYSELTKLDIK